MLEVVGLDRMRMQLAIQASVAAWRGTNSSAVRPDEERSETTYSQDGREVGARFW